MPIAINGSGTVTGSSVGGLPDGIVDTDMIAAAAVTAPMTPGLPPPPPGAMPLLPAPPPRPNTAAL